MSDIQSIVNTLISRAGQMDPVLQSILQEILNELDRLAYEIDPAPIVATKISVETKAINLVPTDFTYEFNRRYIILRWNPGNGDFQYYELRKGTDWNTAAHILITSNLEVRLDPLSVGTHTYLLRSYSIDGEYSEAVASVTFTIPAIGPINITAELAVNNVLLKWTTPTSTFDIDYYIILKNGVEIARQDGTFFAYAESVKASYRYTIVSVDLAGNIGPDSSVVVDVQGFPDFALQAAIKSTFNGIKNNAKVDGLTRLIVPLNITETYTQHFTVGAHPGKPWASPQIQVNNGYPIWITPTTITAYYEEVFDFGYILTNVIVTISWMFEVLGGSFTFGIDARVSDNGSTYGSPYTTQSFYVPSMRYIKIRMSFTGSNDKALLAFSNFIVSVSVKREQDAGVATADANDINGTVVTFNKAFKDIDGITIAPMSLTTVIPIVEFLDVPNPTSFKIKIYDNAGVRKTVTFRWDARGVI